jgi:hypothetical protein
MKNKRNLLLLPFLLLPVVGLTVAFTSGSPRTEPEVINLSPFFMRLNLGGPAIYCLAAVVLVVIFIATYIQQSHTNEELTAGLFFVKITQLITWAALLLSLLAFANTRGIQVSPFFYWLLLFSLLLSGCFGFFLLLNVAKSTRVRTGWVFLVCVLQFIFVLDVVSSLLLWLRMKKIRLDAGEVGSEPTDPAETCEEIEPASSPKKKVLRRLRYLLLLPGLYLPYSVLTAFIIILNAPPPINQTMSFLFLILVVPIIVTIPLNLIFVITGLGDPDASKKMARVNMVVRLLQIPGYIINFIVGMLFMITIFTMAISLMLAFIDMLCLVATGILGTAAVMSAVKEGKMPVRAAFFASIFNYIYCLDVVYAIVLFVYLAAKRVGKRPFTLRKRLQVDPDNKSAPAESLGG